MKTIGIDYGDARVGIASADETGTLATAVCTVEVKGMRDAVKKVAEKARELGTELAVIGMPLNMNGSQSFRAEKTKAFAELLKAEAGVETEFVDERLSTVEAYTYLNITDYKSSRRRKIIDALSAQIILQSYLDAQKNKKQM